MRQSIRFGRWRLGDQEARRYFLVLCLALLVLNAWSLAVGSYLFMEGARSNWMYLVFVGAVWLLPGAYIVFQARYALRVDKLMADVHHLAFKKDSILAKGEAADIVYKGIRTALKSRGVAFTSGESGLKIPEIGRYRYNLYLKKQGVRLLIKKNTTIFPGDGSVILLSEKGDRGSLLFVKGIISEAAGIAPGSDVGGGHEGIK
jgi:hypothetical protein